MPLINIRGLAVELTNPQISYLAGLDQLSVNQFKFKYSFNGQAQPYTKHYGALEQTIEALLIQIQPINANQDIEQEPVLQTNGQTLPAPTFEQVVFTPHINSKSIFTTKKRDSSVLLQDLYKYKSMVLRKADSTAFEKTHTVKTPYKWTTMEGMIGIEIEVENITNPVPLAAYWDHKADGSLRNNGAEFVSVPLHIKQIQLALEHLFDALNASNNPDFSNRTSVHIHVNCRDLTQDQLYNFILLYAIFEKHFYQIAGTRRMNSIFCVPLFRTNQLHKIETVVYDLNPDWHKYCGLNLLPLYANSVTQGYGTIEFRHLYGTNNILEILNWINDILCLRQAAIKMTTDDLLANIKNMNTTSSYMELYYQVFEHGRKILSNKKDFEECVSNIKRELFGNQYAQTLEKVDRSVYWNTAAELNIRG